MRKKAENTAGLAAELSKRFGVAGHADASELPSAPGAYLLLLELRSGTTLDLAGFRGAYVPAGRYLYAGSARGPGGLRARIARHLRRTKKPHWHTDRLTKAAETVLAFPIPGGRECTLVQTLLDSGKYRHPLPGFGSSDCRTCASHLLAPN